MPHESESNFFRNNLEMKTAVTADVTCLGKVLEGDGKIHSRIEENEYGNFASALKESIAEIEEADCPACIDGRRCICQADGSETKLRPRKAGAGLSSFAMVGMGDRLAISYLQGNAHNSDDVYDFIAKLQHTLGNKESGHFDCGAAKGLIKHARSIPDLDPGSPEVGIVRDMVSSEAPSENAGELIKDVVGQAAPFADVLERCGWNGDDYVNKVAAKEPSGVEKLEVDEDDPVGGHAEDAVIIVDGPTDSEDRPIHTVDEEKLFQLTGRRAFIINLNEIRRDASQLGSHATLKARLFTAALLHHLSAYKNLADGSQPLFLVQIH